ncbi:hypothetical protein ACWEKM_46515 [Streptomyces sp. NPDC004752]
MRTKIAACLGTLSLSAGMLLAMPGAAHADGIPYRYNVPVGQTYTKGHVIFYNRSVGVVGEQKSVTLSSCRYTKATAFDSSDHIIGQSSSTPVCGASAKVNLAVTADVPGGADYVLVCLMHWRGDEELKCQSIP